MGVRVATSVGALLCGLLLRGEGAGTLMRVVVAPLRGFGFTYSLPPTVSDIIP